MNNYESVIIVKPNLKDENYDGIIEKVSNIVFEKGKINKVDKLGNKMLAYEVKNNKEGYYILFDFEMEHNDIINLERYYREDDNILKFITVKKDLDD